MTTTNDFDLAFARNGLFGLKISEPYTARGGGRKMMQQKQ
jgi:hypothetical protein